MSDVMKEKVVQIINGNLNNRITPELSLGIAMNLIKMFEEISVLRSATMVKTIEEQSNQIKDLEKMLEKERSNLKEFYIPKPINAKADQQES